MKPSTRAGVGFSENHDSFSAGKEAASLALAQGGLNHCDLLLVFATTRQDPKAFLAGLRSVVGQQTRIIGGSAIGIITNDELGYDGYQVGVAALRLGDVSVDLYQEGSLPDNELAVGRTLGQAIAGAKSTGEPQILLMYDSMNHMGAQPKMNMATPLLQGLLPHLPRDVALAGIGQCGDTPRDPVVQWFDDEAPRQTAQAVVFTGNVRLDTAVMHGCRPAGSYHEITKSEGPLVLEIDGRPALEVVGEMLGQNSGYSVADYRFFVTLGVNRGERFGAFDAENYANRLCCGVDEERGGLIMFEPDLVSGTQVQLMRRSVDFDYIAERGRALLQRINDRRVFLALYIDCAGRAAAYCGSEAEEATEVQRLLGDKIPLLGVYCGVELARVGPGIAPLDWSGVLCLFSEAI